MSHLAPFVDCFHSLSLCFCDCPHLSLINISLLVYLVSMFPFLYASSSLFSVSSVPTFSWRYSRFLMPACWLPTTPLPSICLIVCLNYVWLNYRPITLCLLHAGLFSWPTGFLCTEQSSSKDHSLDTDFCFLSRAFESVISRSSPSRYTVSLICVICTVLALPWSCP